MRRILPLMAILALAGCTLPGGPIATPNTTTPPGYRQAMTTWANQVNAEIQLLHTACAGGDVTRCTVALDRANAVTYDVEQLITVTAPPGACRLFGASFTSIPDNATAYREAVRRAIDSNNTALLIAVDSERYASWSRGWTQGQEMLRSGECQ